MIAAIEEARRFLRLADADREAFLVLKDAPQVKLRIVCFHAQQAVEKSLKAVLVLRGVEFRKTHDLNLLAQLLLGYGLALPYPPEELTKLNPHAVVFRYDDIEVDTLSRDEALVMMDAVFRWAGETIDQAATDLAARAKD